MRDSLLIARVGVLLGLMMAFIVGSHFLLNETLHSFFSSNSTQLHGVAAAILVFSGLATDVVLPVPSSVISVWAYVSQGLGLGFVVVWAGMMTACVLGYLLGAGAGRSVSQKFIKSDDLDLARQLFNRFGSLALVLCRAVPVLAEASIICAGIAGMPLRRFLFISALANAGIALAYGVATTWAVANASFGLVFFASVSLPLTAVAIYKLIPKTMNTENSLVSRDEQLLPSFSMQFSYPLCFTRNVFDPKNVTLVNELHRNKAVGSLIKVQIFIDDGVVAAHPNLQQAIQTYCRTHHIEWSGEIISVPGAEAAKSQQQIERMHGCMLQAQLDRQSYVIAIGGGGVLDAVGYAASTFHRGIRLVRMPTTVLAQNDAGVGVKNGINSQGIKNLLGCFAVPHAIINDAVFLESLSQRDFRSGFAEAIKVALIRDARFYQWIDKNAEALNQRNETACNYLIKRCAELHINQICNGGDPFEMGSARPLDYGHWSAHKLESLTGHELSHGEAVALGMALDALYAVEAALLPQHTANQIIGLIQRLGFEVWHPALNWNCASGESALLKGLEEFRQHLGGELCITLLTGIGKTLEANHIDTEGLLRARDKLKNFAPVTESEVSG